MQLAPPSWNALQEQFDTHGAVQVRGLPASPDIVGDPQINILLLRTHDGSTVIAVPDGLNPPQGSPLAPLVANAPSQDGWRLVHLVPGTELESAWEHYQRMFVSAAPAQCQPGPQADQSEQAVPAQRLGTPPPFCSDMLAAARDGHLARAIGRDAEVSQLVEALGGSIKRSACLVGDPGVGKTAIVEELAHRIVTGDVPSHLQGAGLWQLDLSRFIGGSAQHGDVERRVSELVRPLLSYPPDQRQPVLFVDELHATVSARGDLSLAELLKPHLSRGLRIIGATTSQDWSHHIEPDRALVRRFQRVHVPAPNRETTVAILQARLPELEAHHRLSASPNVLPQVVDLSDRWLWGRAQPDKALELLDAAFSHQARQSPGEPVTSECVVEPLARIAGLRPEDLLRAEDPRAVLTDIEENLRSRIIGQPQLLQPLLDALRSRLLCGLEDRPQVCLLFAGPSGVGKTETAVQLARAYAGTTDALIRIDGSEFSEPHSVARLIGSPPGYVGYGEGGQLTEAVKRRPRCVVLFDEVEKTAPAVHNLLLQIMSAGRLTDASGDTVDFRHACLIMTSNLGNEDHPTPVQAGSQVTDADHAAHVLAAVRRSLPVELLGRLDAIVPFRRLSIADLECILDLRLADLAERIPQVDALIATPQARTWLARRAWSPEYGARELDRVLRTDVEALLARMLWDGDCDLQAVSLCLEVNGGRLAVNEAAATDAGDG